MKKLLLTILFLSVATFALATKYGEPKAVVCPECGKLLQQTTLISGNRLRSTYWSDTKIDSPMLPEIPYIVKCPECGTIFFPQANYATEPVARDLIKSAPNTRKCMLDFDDYTKAFDIIPNERTAYMSLIMAYNDYYRNNQASLAEQRVHTFAAYVKEFLGTLDESIPNDRILKAELYREIKEYDTSVTLLKKHKFDKPLDNKARQILEKARAEDHKVFKFKP